MRSKRALKNFKFDAVITIIIIFLSFFSRKIFIDYMGENITGVMLLFTQLMGFLNLAELGVGTATASVLYKPLFEKNFHKVNVLINSTKKIYKFISLSVFIIGVIVGIFIYFFIPSLKEVPYSYGYWAIFVLNTSFSYFYAHNIILLTASQHYYKARLIQGISKVLVISLQLVVIFYFKNFLFYLLIESIFLFFQYLAYNKKVKTDYEFLKHTIETDNSIVLNIKQMFFHKLGGVLIFNTDYLLISKYLSLSYVTIYSSYLMVFQAISMFLNILVNSMTASVGDYLSEKSKEDISIFCRQLYSLFFFLSTFFTIIIYLTINDFIRLWLGTEFILSDTIVILMMLNVFISFSQVATNILKNASGIFSDIHLPIFEGVINLALSWFLVQKWGIAGILIGTLISSLLIVCYAKPIYLFNRLLYKTPFPYLSIFFKNILMSLLSILFVYFIVKFLALNSPSDFMYWIFNSTIITLISGIVTTTVFINDYSFRNWLSRLFPITKYKIKR